MASASSIPQRRHAGKPRPRDLGAAVNKKVRLLASTPPVIPESTPRLQPASAKEYGCLLITELQEHAPRALSAAVITLGSSEKDVAIESSYYDACAEAFIYTKLRELMTALLSGLCGVPHPNTAMPSGLYPRTHFIDWLREAFSLGTKVFELQPQSDPLQHRSALHENIGKTDSAKACKSSKPDPISSALCPTSSIPGKASKLHFREILIMFDALKGLTPEANGVVHSLTISDVARVLIHPTTGTLMDTEALKCLVVLVESIIGCTIEDVMSDWDSQLVQKQFKAVARNYRRKISDTMLIMKIEKDWRGKWDEARAQDLIQDLINRKKVVRMEEHEAVKQELDKVKKELDEVTTELVEVKKEMVEVKNELQYLRKENEVLRKENEILRKENKDLGETMKNFAAPSAFS
ncbi:hypothetical protein EV426DRAFT_578663 [Tirmania nivea]|nr:hypothetical protein EV426DRAFT_578663 [Tirmania nivea]